MNDINFTEQEKVSEMGNKLREYLEWRIGVLHKKLEKQGLPMDETEGIRRTIEETRKFLLKLEVKP